MLTGKHANIGNTVCMIRGIHKLTTDPKMAEEITKLFMAEAESCDYGKDKICTFPRLPELAEDSDARHACMISHCPFGKAVDNEIKKRDLEFGCGPDLGSGTKSRMQLYGQNTMGGHVHIGYTGWRKYWNIWKNNMLHGWGDWLKEWPTYLRKHWKANLIGVLIVLVVYYGSQWLGHLSAGG